jgi:putative transposase
MNERIHFINDYLSEQWSLIELSELYAISRESGHNWLDRYRRTGFSGLAENPRPSRDRGPTTAGNLVAAIIGLHHEQPSWGPRKIIAKLAAGQPGVAWPTPSTAGEILKRAGLASGRRRRGSPPPHASTIPQYANHVWGVDHRAWVRLGDGSRVEPLAVMDGFSRYLIGATTTTIGTAAHAKAKLLLERAFQEHGLPQVIRSDSGALFTSRGATGLTPLTAWWIKLGIKQERVDPGLPRQSDRHERLHMALLEALQPMAANRSVQERRFTKFMRDYNEERPHEALGQRTPASVYRRSRRLMPARLPEPDYPAEAEVRKVRSNGEIKWQGQFIFISEVLIGEHVAMEETEAGQWQARFFDTPIGWIDPGKRKLCRLATPDEAG